MDLTFLQWKRAKRYSLNISQASATPVILPERAVFLFAFQICVFFILLAEVELVRNLVAHGYAREGKWRGNRRMEWVASTLTRPSNVVYPPLLTLMHKPRLPAVDWTDAPRRLKWTRPFRGKTKSGLCGCTTIFRTSSTSDFSSWWGVVQKI